MNQVQAAIRKNYEHRLKQEGIEPMSGQELRRLIGAHVNAQRRAWFAQESGTAGANEKAEERCEQAQAALIDYIDRHLP